MPIRNTVLSVAIKSKRIAVAVFSGEQLLHYAANGLISSESGPSEIAAQTIKRLIEVFSPTHIAIENLTYVQQRVSLIINIRDKVSNLAQISHLALVIYSPKTVLTYFATGKRPSKMELAKRMAHYYPELSKYLVSQNDPQKRYALFIFGAIAAGLYCIRNLYD